MSGIVKCQAPLIAAAVCEDLKLVTHRMIPPHSGAERYSLLLGCTGLTNRRGIEHTLITVEPTIGPPSKTVQAFVRVLIAETVEQHLRWTIGMVVAIAIGNKQ